MFKWTYNISVYLCSVIIDKTFNYFLYGELKFINIIIVD